MDIEELITKFEGHTVEVKTLLTGYKGDTAALAARLLELEQKAAKGGGGGFGGRPEWKSWGAQVACSDALRDYIAAGAKGRARIELKTIAAMSDTGSAGSLAPPDRQPDVDTLARRQLHVKDLLRPGKTTSNVVQIMRQTSRTINAASVAEADLKPQSDLGFELVDFPVRTIAHFVMASKQVLADAPVLQTTIETELTYGLELVEDDQLLNGDGTGVNLLGLIPQATAFDTSFTQVGDTMIDTVRRAALQSRLALYPATGIVLNPTDWATIETTKDANGRYIFGNPGTGAPPAMWNKPVVETEAIAEGHFLVGAFGTAAQVFDREEDAIYISTEDRDNFIRNLVTILCEERVALAVRRPTAMIYGAFS